ASAQNAAIEHGHPELLPEHLLAALLTQPESIASAIVQKAGATPKGLLEAVNRRIDALPRAQGGSEPSLSRRLRDLLTAAWKETSAQQDEYTSAGHVLL